MRTVVIIIMLFYATTSIYSQEKDSIIYILPDKVEQKLYEQIKKVNIIDLFNFEFYLESLDKEMFRIAFTYHNNSLSDNYWTKNTNRFIVINEKKYPLILDYDSIFSTKKTKEIGEYGKREGYILRSVFMYEGYNITFDKTGKFIQENDGFSRNKSE